MPMRYPRESASSTSHSKVPQAEWTSTASSISGSWIARSAYRPPTWAKANARGPAARLSRLNSRAASGESG